MTIKEKIQEALDGALKEFSYDPPREVYSECRMDWDINLFSKNDRSKKVQKKLFLIGQEVLKRTYDNVDLLIKNETSKT